MSCEIEYWHDDKVDAMWASWEWDDDSDRKDGRVCAVASVSPVETNPLLEQPNPNKPFVVVKLGDGTQMKSPWAIAGCDDIPQCLNRCDEGYECFSDAYETFKSRLPNEVLTNVLDELNRMIEATSEKMDKRREIINALERVNNEDYETIREARRIIEHLRCMR